MATFKFCDWTKERLVTGEATFIVVVDGQEYEVCGEGMRQIVEQMKSDIPFTQTMTVPVVTSTQPGPVPQIVVAPAPQPVEHIPSPNSMPQPPMAQQEEVQEEASPVLAAGEEVVVPIEFPENPLRPLPMPSAKQRKQVIAESIKFEEGTLGALTYPKARKAAAKKLRSLESDTEGNFRRTSGGGNQFKINDNWREY